MLGYLDKVGSPHHSKVEMPNFTGYLTVNDAAKILGVAPSTLRNWDRQGKVKAIRHPVNRYRLYRKKDLIALLGKLREQERTRR